MVVERAAQVGGNALAEPGDQGETGGAGGAEGGHDGEHEDGGDVELGGAARGKALVDQVAEALAYGQHQAGGDQQGGGGARGLGAVRAQVGEQEAEGCEAVGHGGVLADNKKGQGSAWTRWGQLAQTPISAARLLLGFLGEACKCHGFFWLRRFR